MSEHQPPTEAEVFAYLDMLRASGATNMFGAGPYLQRDMGLDRRQVEQFLLKWMRTFADRQRAAEASQ